MTAWRVALWVLLCAGTLRLPALTLGEYRAELRAIDAALAAKDLPAAQTIARRIHALEVEAGADRFAPDPTLFEPLLAATSIDGTSPLQSRLKRLLAALPEESALAPTTAAPPAEAELIRRLRSDEANPLPPRDGQIDDYGIASSGAWGWIKQKLRDFWAWAYGQWNSFWAWFRSLLPTPTGVSAGGILILKWMAIVLTVVAAVVIARMVLRYRAQTRTLPAESLGPAASEKDADPLSRGSSEWEHYAEKLAAAGRYREAVRAWYHAALVALFRSGILHYRKGRTNWEYCFALSPNLNWRERFHDLTRAFETEWYGSEQSFPETVSACESLAKGVMASSRQGYAPTGEARP